MKKIRIKIFGGRALCLNTNQKRNMVIAVISALLINLLFWGRIDVLAISAISLFGFALCEAVDNT